MRHYRLAVMKHCLAHRRLNSRMRSSQILNANKCYYNGVFEFSYELDIIIKWYLEVASRYGLLVIHRSHIPQISSIIMLCVVTMLL
jgi:hypothetical protein